MRPNPLPTFLVSLFAAFIGGVVAWLLLAARPPVPVSTGAAPPFPLPSPIHETAPPHAVEKAIVDAARIIGPSVVNIDTRVGGNGFLQNGTNGMEPARGQGSGVIVSADGYILTNDHVVRDANQIEVTLPEPDGRKLTGTVKGADRLSDLAIIKVDATGLPAARLGDSDAPPIGALVLAVGNPFGFQHTVTMGVLSGRGREIPEPGKEFRNLLQTDAAINPGNSGGPLVDIEGRVIGINTAVITQAQGLSFAIPINTAREVMNQLLTKGRVIRSYIGVIMMPLTPRLAQHVEVPEGTEGAVVRQVVPKSPADEVGLLSGDVIVAVDGRPTPGITQVQSAIRTHKPGERVTVTILRKAARRQLEMQVTEMPPLTP